MNDIIIRGFDLDLLVDLKVELEEDKTPRKKGHWMVTSWPSNKPRRIEVGKLEFNLADRYGIVSEVVYVGPEVEEQNVLVDKLFPGTKRTPVLSYGRGDLAWVLFAASMIASVAFLVGGAWG